MHYQITSKCDVRNEPEYDRWSINSEVSEHTKAREQTLREQRHNDPEGYAVAYKQCPRCDKSFKTKRDTKQHLRRCRREGSVCVRIKVNGVYPCQVCSKVNNTLDQFKQHIFYKHQEDQMQSAYLQGWETLLGSTFLGKLRTAIMNKIANDRWKEHILLFMNARAPFDLSGINFKIPITGLIEKEVVERRTIFYRF